VERGQEVAGVEAELLGEELVFGADAPDLAAGDLAHQQLAAFLRAEADAAFRAGQPGEEAALQQALQIQGHVEAGVELAPQASTRRASSSFWPPSRA
jgi:hypothetical protein